MRALAIIAVSLLAFVASETMAHHKPGHKPPGHAKHNRQVILPTTSSGAIRPEGTGAFVDEHTGSNPSAERVDWELYEDYEYGFNIDLPVGLFEVVDDAPRGTRLREVGGGGVLDVYGGVNTAGLEPGEIQAELEANPQIAEVTYRARGRNWIVLSGYYIRDDYAGDDLIFYAKFMFSADQSRLSAFEISYPESDRKRFDSIVGRLEESLSAPRSR